MNFIFRSIILFSMIMWMESPASSHSGGKNLPQIVKPLRRSVVSTHVTKKITQASKYRPRVPALSPFDDHFISLKIGSEVDREKKCNTENSLSFWGYYGSKAHSFCNEIFKKVSFYVNKLVDFF